MKGAWKAKAEFSLHNPTSTFFYQIWIKMTINSESISCEDIEIAPPDNIEKSLLSMGNYKYNSFLNRLDGIDPKGERAIYLILESLAPGKTYTFRVSDRSRKHLRRDEHWIGISVIRTSDQPSPRAQKIGKKSIAVAITAPPEEIEVKRLLLLLERGNFVEHKWETR
jgi:hypothetical protein